MRIALLFPPGVRAPAYPPLGLAYLASSLREAGHKVIIIDASVLKLSYNEVVKKLKQFEPDMIGITCLTTLFRQVKNQIYAIKKELPNVPLVCGGPHPTVLPEQTLIETLTDIVVIGEGERTIVELADAIEKGSSLQGVRGIAYKEHSKIVITPPRELIKDLDSLPFPARDLLPLSKYSGDICEKQRPSTSAIASRGCPFNCLFCTVRTIWGRRFRQRSVENVIDELKELRYKFKIKEVAWQDDNFTLRRSWVINLCRSLLQEKLDITWRCFLRVDAVDKELLKWMKKAGCHALGFGIESGDQEILYKIRKNITLQQARDAVKLAKQLGFDINLFFMIGNYGENLKSIINTIRFAKELNPDYISVSIATPFPGSDFYTLALNENLIEDKKWDKLWYYQDAVIRTKDLTSKDLIKLKNYMEAIFYGRKEYFKENVLLKLKDYDLMNIQDLKKIFYKTKLFTVKALRSVQLRKSIDRLFKRVGNQANACIRNAA